MTVRDTTGDYACDTSVTRAAKGAGRPGLAVRAVARAYLRGALTNLPELMAPEFVLAGQDPTSGALFDAAAEAGRVLSAAHQRGRRRVA